MFQELPAIAAGILLTPGMTAEDAWALYEEYEDHKPVLIHAGFADVQGLSKKLGKPNVAVGDARRRSKVVAA